MKTDSNAGLKPYCTARRINMSCLTCSKALIKSKSRAKHDSPLTIAYSAITADFHTQVWTEFPRTPKR
eukprot:6580046-Pyramimonas_sp.AAC.2